MCDGGSLLKCYEQGLFVRRGGVSVVGAREVHTDL